MARRAELAYVYGIVRSGFAMTGAPAGLDDGALRLVGGGAHAAITSGVSADEYAPAEIERLGGDVSWLSPRAQAHDRVLTWAQERDVVLPLPIFSLWAGDDAVARSLAAQKDHLDALLRRVAGADEFGLRVHRRDDALLAALDDVDPEAARLSAEARAASPGQRYLLERKLAEYGRGAVKAAGQRMARDVYERLRALARDAVARPIAPDSARASEATMILNGAFLVDRAGLDGFRAAVGAVFSEYEPKGLTFDFTGPWPPYNFVADAGTPALDGARA